MFQYSFLVLISPIKLYILQILDLKILYVENILEQNILYLPINYIAIINVIEDFIVIIIYNFISWVVDYIINIVDLMIVNYYLSIIYFDDYLKDEYIIYH